VSDADLAGTTVLIRTPTGIEVRDALDGRVTAAIPTSATWWALARDGSYVAGGDANGLTIWSTTGQVLATRPGNYSTAAVFAAATELRVATGPAGANVIEYVAAAGGASTVSPAFLGGFHSWFLDGERFLTNLSNTVRTYSRAAVQLDIASLPNITRLGGTGNWFWIEQASSLRLYTVGASAAPSASYAMGTLGNFSASGTTLAVWPYGESKLIQVDLSGSTPVSVDIDIPNADLSSYAATSTAHWILGHSSGVVVDGPSTAMVPRYLSLGAVRSIAGSSTRFAIATASGSIRYYNASTRELEGSIPFPSSQLQLSSDGTVLAARGNSDDAQYYEDRSIKLFSLPSAATLATYPYTYASLSYPASIALSASGTVLVRTFSSLGSQTHEVTGVPGTPVAWSFTTLSPGVPPVSISPDGSLVAVASTPDNDAAAITNIFSQGALVSAVPGRTGGWIDNNRLLSCIFELRRITPIFKNCSIFDASGNLIAVTALPEPIQMQVVDGDSVYAQVQNTIYSLSTGAALWTSAAPTRRVGAVAGGHVVFTSGPWVVAEAF
jgi:hypothetical protein